VALVRTDISEEIIAYIIRVKRIRELGTLGVMLVLHLLVTTNDVPSLLILSTLMTDVICLRNVGYYKSHAVSRPIFLHTHRREHLKSYIAFAPIIILITCCTLEM
jgi:hypothetical protein